MKITIFKILNQNSHHMFPYTPDAHILANKIIIYIIYLWLVQFNMLHLICPLLSWLSNVLFYYLECQMSVKNVHHNLLKIQLITPDVLFCPTNRLKLKYN